MKGGFLDWHNPHAGFSHRPEPKQVPVVRERHAFFTVDEVDLAVWERRFNMTFGLH